MSPMRPGSSIDAWNIHKTPELIKAPTATTPRQMTGKYRTEEYLILVCFFFDANRPTNHPWELSRTQIYMWSHLSSLANLFSNAVKRAH